MQSKQVRLEDVAQKAGVSITTVSHVINKTRYVKRETRELVLKTLDELHYDIRKPRSRRNGSRLIGVIVADITEDYYISVVKAIETYATEQSYSILLCDSEDDVEKEKYNIKNILDKDVAGLIIAPGSPRLQGLWPAVPGAVHAPATPGRRCRRGIAVPGRQGTRA